jgi:hypothetical protein
MWVVYGATWQQLSVKLKRKPKRRWPNFIQSSHDDIARAHYCFETRLISKEAGLPTHKPSLNITIVIATRDETSPFTLVMELVEFPSQWTSTTLQGVTSQSQDCQSLGRILNMTSLKYEARVSVTRQFYKNRTKPWCLFLNWTSMEVKYSKVNVKLSRDKSWRFKRGD